MADVVGFSRLMGMDEAGTLARLRAHRSELIDPKIAKHGGRIVKTMEQRAFQKRPSDLNAWGYIHRASGLKSNSGHGYGTKNANAEARD